MKYEWLGARRAVLARTLESAEDLAGGVLAAGARGVYLARAIITGRIPTELMIADDLRTALHDTDAWLNAVEREAARMPKRYRELPVRVVSGTVVDVTDTSASTFTTGIQRVAREVVGAWAAEQQLELAAWTRSGALRVLSPEERRRAGDASGVAERPALIVPDRAKLMLPEIALDAARAQRLATVARHGASASLAIGFDCVPITSPATAPPGMPGAFARYLAGIARFDRIATISHAAALEFGGWAEALPAAGLTPPEVVAVPLPIRPVGDGSSAPSPARGDRPLVVCVGSHEPRKNHLTILTAAELAWRRGADFELVLAGGRSWDSAEFDSLAARLIAEGRPLTLETSVSDAELARRYRQARCSIFASFNEGFGLPIAESIAMGTPVITADFGSQREVGAGHGAILVDPRDARAIATELMRVLSDDELHARLAAEARATPHGSWADYAARLALLLD